MPKSVSLPFIAALFSLAAFAGAQSRSANLYAGAGNLDAASNYVAHGYEGSSGSLVSMNSTKTWSGEDSYGRSQTMSFNFKGTAQSAYGQLKTTVDATVRNPFYSPVNDYYFDGSDVNEDGSPDALIGASTASFSDVLQYTGTGLNSGYKAKYVFYVHGSATGANVNANLNVTIGNNPAAYLDLDLSSGSVAQYWSTPSYTIDTSMKQSANVIFTSRFDSMLRDEMEGVDLRGVGDFSPTITLTAIQVFDQNDNLVSNVSVLGASGTRYAVTPEPASWAALGAGALALLRRRRSAR